MPIRAASGFTHAKAPACAGHDGVGGAAGAAAAPRQRHAAAGLVSTWPGALAHPAAVRVHAALAAGPGLPAGAPRCLTQAGAGLG